MLPFLAPAALTILDTIAVAVGTAVATTVAIRLTHTIASRKRRTRKRKANATNNTETFLITHPQEAQMSIFNLFGNKSSGVPMHSVIEYGRQKKDGSHDHRYNIGVDWTPAQKAEDKKLGKAQAN